MHVPGGLYHAILRGNHRQVIFHGESDFLAFESILDAALKRYGARVHAYCWMPNHVHLAVQVGEPPLGRVMHVLASRYSRCKQRQVPTNGHLFERRYRAKLVQADQYLLALVRYIHLNPVRAGFVTDAAAYCWSSHRAYLGLVATKWLEIAPTLEMFASDRIAAVAAYQKFMVSEPPPDEIPHIHPVVGQGLRLAVAQPAVTGQPAPGSTPRDLEAIVLEVARELGSEVAELRSARRLPVLVRARAEIARRALREGVATLSQVASRLGRAPSSLSELLSKTPNNR